jgi:hypothetical protein
LLAELITLEIGCLPMKKLRNFIVWSLVFVGLLLAFDLLMVRSTAFPPWAVGVQRFYIDFRGRIINLVGGSQAVSIEQVIATTAQPDQAKAAKKTSDSSSAQRYLYADADGALHFADSLNEVPEQYRAAAQPLQE